MAPQAGRKLKARVVEIASAVPQADSASLDLQDGRIADTDSGVTHISLQDVARLVYFRSGMLPPGVQQDLIVARHNGPCGYPFAFSNGIHASLVEVDPPSSVFKLLKPFVVSDCGRIINPMLLDEQVRGGIVQGLCAAFFEERRCDDRGRLLNGSMAEELVPMACEVPDIVIRHAETPTLDSDIGAKGLYNKKAGLLRPFAEAVRCSGYS
jgi:carbon-monoxide dehydrogenase large subunit